MQPELEHNTITSYIIISALFNVLQYCLDVHDNVISTKKR